MLSRVLAPLACIALIATPAVAQSSAQSLSLEPLAERAGADMDGANAMEGGSWIAPVLAAAIVIGGILLATGVLFDDDEPTSP